MTMRLMAGVLLVHGLIHLMGAAKAFGYARLPQHGVPIDVFHRLVDGQATMRVKLAGVFPIADARGDAMNRSEAMLTDRAIRRKQLARIVLRQECHGSVDSISGVDPCTSFHRWCISP